MWQHPQSSPPIIGRSNLISITPIPTVCSYLLIPGSFACRDNEPGTNQSCTDKLMPRIALRKLSSHNLWWKAAQNGRFFGRRKGMR